VVTIREVAELAGVSAPTVSRVVNGSTIVNSQMASRVRQAVEQLDYKPSAIARNLRQQRSSLWMLLIGDVENPFFTTLARGVEDVAHTAGYSLVLCNTDEDAEKESRYIETALRENAAGVIIAPVNHATDVSKFERRNTKVVCVDRSLANGSFDSVLIDSREAAKKAVMHLIEEGWTKIACITGPASSATAEERALGYADAVTRAAELQDFEPIVRYSNFKFDGGYSATGDLLDGFAPDALLAANNLMALGAIEKITERGLRLGEDVGLVSFGEPPRFSKAHSDISYIADDPYQMGVRAGQLLVQREAEHSEPAAVHIALKTELIIRQSSIRPHQRSEAPTLGEAT
jgi:LacI family transcriptional regulator